MDWFVKSFIRASLAWCAAGVSLGLAMAIHPAWAIYRTAHLHMNLLGFVSMMIFGVAYHVLPRIVGRSLHNPRLAVAHWWLANIGLATFVSGFMLLPNTSFGTVARVVVGSGALFSTVEAYAFVYNLWRTLDRPNAQRVATMTTAPRDIVALRRSGR